MEHIGFSLRCRDASKHARPLKARAGAILSLPPHSVGKSNHMVKPNVNGKYYAYRNLGEVQEGTE